MVKGGYDKNVNSHETKASGTSGLVVFHHHAVDDFPIATEVPLQAVLGRFPAETSDKEFPSRRGGESEAESHD